MNIPITILAAAAIMGLLGDILLKANLQHNTLVGVAVPLLTFTLALASCLLACASKIAPRRKGLAYFIPALLFSIAFVVRNSPTLLCIDLGIIISAIAFASFSLMGTPLARGSLTNYASALVCIAITPVFNTIELLVHNINWNEMMSESSAKHLTAFIKGLAIATPLVGIFLSLFLAADPAFAAIAQKTFKIDLGDLAVNLIISSAVAWLAAGFLHGISIFKYDGGLPSLEDQSDDLSSALLTNTRQRKEEGVIGSVNLKALVTAGAPPPAVALPEGFEYGEIAPASRFSTLMPESKPFALGLTEMATVLGCINLLFAGFVAVQMQYLFGGASLITLTPGLSYADYVHKGFFELNTVVALVLPLLLIADSLLQRKSKIGEYTFRLLAGTQIALVLVILASAFLRMFLYQEAFGLSELRLYVTVFMTWLGSVCAIFAATVLSGNRQRFAFGSYLSGLAIIFGLNLANPDALVQATNVAQAKLRPQDFGLVLNQAPKNFDLNYALSLSNDAIPPLLDGLKDLPQEQAKVIAEKLLAREKASTKDVDQDWRLYNVGRKQAEAALSSYKKELKAFAGAKQ